jgi:hypothetical protein
MRDTTPDNTNLEVIYSFLGVLYINNALAKVKGSIFFVLNIRNADKRSICALIMLVTLEALNMVLIVETNLLGHVDKSTDNGIVRDVGYTWKSKRKEEFKWRFYIFGIINCASF